MGFIAVIMWPWIIPGFVESLVPGLLVLLGGSRNFRSWGWNRWLGRDWWGSVWSLVPSTPPPQPSWGRKSAPPRPSYQGLRLSQAPRHQSQFTLWSCLFRVFCQWQKDDKHKYICIYVSLLIFSKIVFLLWMLCWLHIHTLQNIQRNTYWAESEEAFLSVQWIYLYV